MPQRYFILVTTLVGCALLLAPWPPLGVPGEWVWPRQEFPVSILGALDRLIWPMICGLAIVAFCASGSRGIDSASPALRWIFVLTLTGLSFLWLNAVRQAAPSPHRELRPNWILYDKYASGYFFEATFKVHSTRQMLGDYEARMAKGDVLHEGTHPPGLLLLNRALLKLTATFPAVVEFSEAIQDRESVRMFREIETAGNITRPLSKTEFAALHMMSLLSTLFVAMTVIPVFGLTQRLVDARTAWRAAALMITVPAIGVFVPRSDVLYACSGMLMAWVVVTALLADHRRRRWPLAILSGVVVFGCLLLSLAHLPVLVMLALFVSGFSLVDLKHRIGQTLETTVVAVASFFIMCGLWKHLTKCDLLNVWRMNLTNHASFYATSPRSWWAWFAVNPLELAMAVGLPMAAVAVVRVLQTFRSIHSSPQTGPTNDRIFAIACTLTWALLWWSGKNMGEAARLWCFVTPWVAMIAAQVGDAHSSHADPDAKNRNWLPLLIAQLIVATITVGRVSGFLEL